MSKLVLQENRTNIQASLVAVLPPAQKSNRTRRADTLYLKTKTTLDETSWPFWRDFVSKRFDAKLQGLNFLCTTSCQAEYKV